MTKTTTTETTMSAFDLILQMLLFTVSIREGRARGACRRLKSKLSVGRDEETGVDRLPLGRELLGARSGLLDAHSGVLRDFGPALPAGVQGALNVPSRLRRSERVSDSDKRSEETNDGLVMFRCPFAPPLHAPSQVLASLLKILLTFPPTIPGPFEAKLG